MTLVTSSSARSLLLRQCAFVSMLWNQYLCVVAALSLSYYAKVLVLPVVRHCDLNVLMVSLPSEQSTTQLQRIQVLNKKQNLPLLL